MRLARTVRNITHAAAVAAMALTLAGCDVVVNSMDGGKAKAVDQWSRSYDLGDRATVEVANTNGRISVEGGDIAAVQVEAVITARAGTEEAAREHLKQVEIVEEKGSGRIRLQTRYPKSLGRSGVDVAYTLRVPRGATVDVETVNGGIVLSSLVGPVRAESTNGGVKGRDMSGSVRASTTNGGVDMQITALTNDGVTLETTNGGIELRVPEQLKGTISARCVNGSISVADLPVEKAENSRRRLEATLNGGGPAIRIETVNGGIRIRRS